MELLYARSTGSDSPKPPTPKAATGSWRSWGFDVHGGTLGFLGFGHPPSLGDHQLSRPGVIEPFAGWNVGVPCRVCSSSATCNRACADGLDRVGDES